MSRVPTWTELRLDVKKLVQLQKKCYESVHHLLDSAIPELDKKILFLNEKCSSQIALEHLKPLPLPLSEYLRRNRPDVVRRADRRAEYLKRKSERRKHLLSTRIINSLEQIRLSSRSSSNYQLNMNKLDKNTLQSYRARENNLHTYYVRCKLSENEMKRLTAKTYKRLPEVKKKHKEEITNHMKVRNYKNRLEYGRKLLENRRNGIIDYPLRSTSYDDRSITSSQSDFSINGYPHYVS